MRNERGFTLLEVLVSLAIIATAVVALLSLQHHALAMIESAEMLEGARLLSERVMGEAEVAGVPGGERKGADGPYTWVVTETRLTPGSMPAGVPLLPGRQLSLAVTWMEGRRAEKLNLAAYVYAR